MKWFDPDKGFGFIACDGEDAVDVFVHFSGIATSAAAADGRRNLTDGQRVEFDVVPGEKGPQAANVAPAE